jgi:hypothetical protein
VQREWQATRSKEGHGKGGKGNGDGDDTTINSRWEVGGGRMTKGGVEGDGDGNEDGYGDGKKGGGQATATATARWWRAIKRAMAMATRVAGEQQQRGRRRHQ